MSYIYASVQIGSMNAKETNKSLADWAVAHAKNAQSTVQLASGDDSGVHLTMLYHGYPTSAGLEAAFKSTGLETLMLTGKVKGLFQVRVPANNVFVIALDIDCPAMQDHYPIVRNAVRAATGEEPKMHPHLGPNGEHLYKNDFHPHITLAYYKSGVEMDADVAAGILNAMDALKGAIVTIGPFVLHKR